MIQFEELKILKQKSLNVRKHILSMATEGGCFIGSAFSCSDIILYLYTNVLNYSKDNLNNPDRDYFFLSKGHAVPALYGTFVEAGILEEKRLENHLKTNDYVYWHPNRNIPGVEFHSGSLGHSLPVSAGVALDLKIKMSKNKVFVLLGDGELNEGSNWEALLVAGAYKLDNLITIVDRNHFQANSPTEELIPLEPLEEKFVSFGCAVKKIDGHNFNDMAGVFNLLPFEAGKPNVIIANTIRGKGIPQLENKTNKWFCNFSGQEYEALLGELLNSD